MVDNCETINRQYVFEALPFHHASSFAYGLLSLPRLTSLHRELIKLIASRPIIMTNSVDDQTPVSRKDVLVKYLHHYDRVSSEGNVKVCSDRQVTDEGRRVLMSEEEPRKRFNTLDLYLALYECVKYTDYQRYIQGFIKATELLEMFCVNLFLFPWKKEIKTLKVNERCGWNWCQYTAVG